MSGQCLSERSLEPFVLCFELGSVCFYRLKVSLKSLYVDFMRQYENLRHMSPVSPATAEDRPKICYLPHHGVRREMSMTMEFHIVFNGS